MAESAAAATSALVTYEITASYPTPEEYVRLRKISGLTPPPPGADFSRAIANSVRCLIARTTEDSGAGTPAEVPKGKAIGMLRFIGDGVIFCQLCDMAVDPAFQRRGIGRALMDDMLAWIDEHAPDAYVSLIADPPGQALYRSRGFVETIGIGMKKSHW